MAQTLHAMKRVAEIQSKRQAMFYKMRMKAHKVAQRAYIRAEIKKGIDILAPAAADKERAISIATKKMSEKYGVTASADKMTN